MIYLNVQISGLSGAPHTALVNIRTTQDALKLRPHLKFLSGDYLTAERMSLDQGTDPQCRLCPRPAPIESVKHIMTECPASAEIHRRLLPELLNTVANVQPSSSLLNNSTQHLTQFLLDCTSFNLPETHRIPTHNPRVSEIFKISRDWCFAISRERLRLMNAAKSAKT